MQSAFAGIDFGSSFLEAAVLDPAGKALCVPDMDGLVRTPAAVCFGKEELLIGEAAEDGLALYPQAVPAVRSMLGLNRRALTLDGQRLSPQLVSALLLKKKKRDAERFLGCPLKKAVITVPGYFSACCHRALRQAALEAGFEEILLCQQDQALLYGGDHLQKYSGQTVLVCNLGGGGLDLLLARIKDGEVTRYAAGGRQDLGGIGWTQALAAFVRRKYFQADMDMACQRELFCKCDAARVRLCAGQEASFTAEDEQGRRQVRLTPEDLQACTEPLLQGFEKEVRDMCQSAAGSGHGGPDAVILCGGAANMPQIRTKTAEIFTDIPVIYADPSGLEAARGAAVLAGRGRQGDFLEEDSSGICEISYGIAVQTGMGERKVCSLIRAGQQLPAEKTEIFRISKEQESLSLAIYTNRSPRCFADLEESSFLGWWTLQPGENLPAGSPIKISFRQEENGRLLITGPGPGGTNNLLVQEAGPLLSEEELRQEKEIAAKLFARLV